METFTAPYTKFAAAYDKMMENVDYVRWADYIAKLFALYNFHPRRVLDVACGTGSTAILLAEKGYEMSGVDRAFEMLLRAREKAKRHSDVHLKLWQQDMRQLTVNQPYDAVLCLYDSINYIITEDEIRKVFAKVSKALIPGGMFIFDVTTEYNILKNFHRQTFAENCNGFSYIWKNLYIHREKICKTVLTFFLREDDYYRKYDELHIQKIYSVDQIKELLEQTGYKLISAFDAFTFNKWNKMSERINFTAVKKE